ncbi:hypothetical protein KKC17_04345 [Patescibacteria group bacterium]|nr:hypothetical protein [Patescibacteria group bacterium]
MADYMAARQLMSIPLEFLLDVIRFPVWWYSKGLVKVAVWCWRSFRINRQKLALGLFVRSFFKPMYQDYSWQGRLISLLARFLILLVKIIRLVVIVVWYLLLILLWLLLLPVSFYWLLI